MNNNEITLDYILENIDTPNPNFYKSTKNEKHRTNVVKNNITLDDILANRVPMFNTKLIEQEYKKKYEEQLSSYSLVSSPNLKYNISEGDVIRYSNDINELSCVSIVLNVKYVGLYKKKLLGGHIIRIPDKPNSYIENLRLKTTNLATWWEIFPYSFFIFKKVENKTIELAKKIAHHGGNTLDFNVLTEADPTINDKIQKRTQLKEEIEKINKKKNTFIEKTNMNYVQDVLDIEYVDVNDIIEKGCRDIEKIQIKKEKEREKKLIEAKKRKLEKQKERRRQKKLQKEKEKRIQK